MRSLRFSLLAILLIALIPASIARAQNQTKPTAACADLRSLTNYELSIDYAVMMPASDNAPEHCRVRGQVLPQVGFEVNLPTQWNGRLHMSGNGGYAGDVLDNPNRRGPPREGLLKLGFVTAVTDTGHSSATEPLGTFAADRQKLLDYAYRSLHVTAVAAKQLAYSYYGTPISKSYFQGCSTGGRQALILAQRFPNDFDGIIAGAPVLDFTGTMLSFARSALALKAAPIPSSKVALLADRIYAGCDAKDGLKDGVIDDPRKCDFKPSRDLPKCDAGGNGQDCFTSQQIAALETIYSDLVAQGKRVFPGWPLGAEIAGPNGRSGWDGWFIREDGAPTTQQAFSETFFRYMVPFKPEPQFEIGQFNADKDLPKLQTIQRILDATDTDLNRFRQRGGKLLMYFGWADPVLNPYMGLEYYQHVTERMGPATTEFFRLFMAPGMFHCGGGVGPSSFDSLQPVMDWLEKGTAPNAIRASRIVQGKLERSRPLCAYPGVAKYKGTGSTDDAANFACVKP
jgi:feruloyl esterase